MHAKPYLSPADLGQIERQIWAELERAAHDPGHDWRRLTLATVTPEGLPDARTVVVRECDVDARQLLIYTDARSPKVRQLRQQPGAVLVACAPGWRWQLRLRCSIEVQTAGLSVASRWATIRLTPGAQDYLFPQAPGQELAPDELDDDSEELPSLSGTGAHPNTIAHHHFCVLTATVQSIDWLELAPQGHRRALFESNGRRCWLAP
ncbi:MAG: hypothetical protein RJA44_927 [Pseudomonadota bacterium]